MTYGRPGVYLTETLLPAPLAQGVASSAAGAIAAPFAQGPEIVTRVQSWTEFTSKFGGYNAAFPAVFGVSQFFNNGGRELYVKRILQSDAAAAEVSVETSGNAVVATFTAKSRGTDGNNLRINVKAGTITSTYTVEVYKEGVTGTAMDITNDVLLERYENINFSDPTSSSYAGTIINHTAASLITVSAMASGTPVLAVYPLTGGSNGTDVTASDYTSYGTSASSVWNEFSSINRALVMFIPQINDILASGQVGVINDAISWAQANNGFFVAETPAEKSADEAIVYAQGLTASSNAAVYYPHTYTVDPLGRSNGAIRLVGPSGAVAGLYLNTDATRSVAKAPAGLNFPLAGAISLEKAFSSAELDNLNTGLPSAGTGSVAPVNAIRQLPGAGIVVMGARTLKQDGTANRYVNMRRSLIYIEQNLKSIAQFAIFENNDETLWARITSTFSSFLNDYRNQGGLRGGTPAQSYYVLCNATNNTATSLQNGIVNIQVGVALEYPAEFVVINLSQMTLA